MVVVEWSGCGCGLVFSWKVTNGACRVGGIACGQRNTCRRANQYFRAKAMARNVTRAIDFIRDRSPSTKTHLGLYAYMTRARTM